MTKVVERAKVDVGDHVDMTVEMVLEVYGHPTQDSHRQMADSLARE